MNYHTCSLTLMLNFVDLKLYSAISISFLTAEVCHLACGLQHSRRRADTNHEAEEEDCRGEILELRRRTLPGMKFLNTVYTH